MTFVVIESGATGVEQSEVTAIDGQGVSCGDERIEA
jgi:hypothetical protein